MSANRSTRKNDEMTKEERKDLKPPSGQVMWVTTQTHLDLSLETCAMSNVGKHSTVKLMHEANRVASKLKS